MATNLEEGITLDVIEKKRKAGEKLAPIQTYMLMLSSILITSDHKQKVERLEGEIEELRQQVTNLQGIIDESNKVMNEAGIPEGEGGLPERIADFAKSKEGSISRERMLQIIHRMQGKKRERHQNN